MCYLHLSDLVWDVEHACVTYIFPIWFSQLWLLYWDFQCKHLVADWCSLAAHILAPPVPYEAILPDQMMAIEELQMTREGMDKDSIRLQCKLKGVEHVVTSTLHQTCGMTRRMVLFFCCKCCSLFFLWLITFAGGYRKWFWSKWNVTLVVFSMKCGERSLLSGWWCSKMPGA